MCSIATPPNQYVLFKHPLDYVYYGGGLQGEMEANCLQLECVLPAGHWEVSWRQRDRRVGRPPIRRRLEERNPKHLQTTGRLFYRVPKSGCKRFQDAQHPLPLQSSSNCLVKELGAAADNINVIPTTGDLIVSSISPL